MAITTDVCDRALIHGDDISLVPVPVTPRAVQEPSPPLVDSELILQLCNRLQPIILESNVNLVDVFH